MPHRHLIVYCVRKAKMISDTRSFSFSMHLFKVPTKLEDSLLSLLQKQSNFLYPRVLCTNHSVTGQKMQGHSLYILIQLNHNCSISFLYHVCDSSLLPLFILQILIVKAYFPVCFYRQCRSASGATTSLYAVREILEMKQQWVNNNAYRLWVLT